MNRDNGWQLFFTVAIPLLVGLGIMVLVMAGPSLDAVVWGR